MAFTSTTPTPSGPFTVIADDDGTVLAGGWTADVALLVERAAGALDGDAITPHSGPSAALDAVVAYHDGDLTAPDAVAVRHRSGPFLTAAWSALRKVPPGQTISYTELAARAGNARAVRAAGSACAYNPTALFVPCHRVWRSDGGIGGFAFGLDVKRWLLAHEGVSGQEPRLPL